METPLLQTKLYIPPVRPEMVSRPRLIERLNAGLPRKLTLVSAPAGFGKTTLLSEWIHSGVRSREYEVRDREYQVGGVYKTLPIPYSILPTPRFAWLSLDEGDNDPARFLAYFVAALQTIEVNVGAGTLGALQSPQPPPIEAVLTALINEISEIPAPFVLILDDYHLITAQPVHDALTFLLDHLPSQMHLVIAGRADPPLPVARLRGRGQLTELRAADLRFTSDEAAAFLNDVMGLGLSTEDIAVLDGRTEGWIAGLQMAALSMQGRKDVTTFIEAFSGTHRFVLDYLVEEVLDRQSSDTQDFLLKTSILERMTAPLCDAILDWRLTGIPNLQYPISNPPASRYSNNLRPPICSSSRWTTSGVGIVITIFSLTCCAAVWSRPGPTGCLSCTVRRASGTNRTD
jgi:LuxR family maltose regulon positive regulatory protein